MEFSLIHLNPTWESTVILVHGKAVRDCCALTLVLTGVKAGPLREKNLSYKTEKKF